MNKDTGLTRKEKKMQKKSLFLASATCYSLYLKLEAHNWVGFSCFWGSMCREQPSYTPPPAVIHVLWFSFMQGVRLALGNAITAWLCPALLTLTGSSSTAPPHQRRDLPLLCSPGLCSEQLQHCSLGGAESSQPLQTQPLPCSV